MPWTDPPNMDLAIAIPRTSPSFEQTKRFVVHQAQPHRFTASLTVPPLFTKHRFALFIFSFFLCGASSDVKSTTSSDATTTSSPGKFQAQKMKKKSIMGFLVLSRWKMRQQVVWDGSTILSRLHKKRDVQQGECQ